MLPALGESERLNPVSEGECLAAPKSRLSGQALALLVADTPGRRGDG
jgi:hypothetical protein